MNKYKGGLMTTKLDINKMSLNDLKRLKSNLGEKITELNLTAQEVSSLRREINGYINEKKEEEELQKRVAEKL